MRFSVYNKTLDTLERAVKERVFFVTKNGKFLEPYRPRRDVVNWTLGRFRQLLKQHLRPTKPMSPQEFVDCFRSRRQKLYQQSIDANAKYGFKDSYAYVSCFDKCEKYNFTTKSDPCPRVIQPRHPRYIVESGRYIRPIEKKIYRAIDKTFSEQTVFKGLNADERGLLMHSKWRRFKNPVAIGLDASRFDQHVSNAMLQWEHSIYELLYPGDKYFSRLMGLQRSNKVFGRVPDGLLKYKTIHNRMSGDSNTSLGNVLIMCALVYSYLSDIGVEASLANDGDDCVLFLEAKDVAQILRTIPSWFHSKGFTMTVEAPVTVFEQIEFCQCHPVLNNLGSYTMVRDPRITLSKDSVSLKRLDSPQLAKRWLACVGKGGISLTQGMPVLQAYYDSFIRNADGAKPLSDPTLEGGFFRLSEGMCDKSNLITANTRFSFWLAFGITPSQQVELEDYYTKYFIDYEASTTRFVQLPIADQLATHC